MCHGAAAVQVKILLSLSIPAGIELVSQTAGNAHHPSACAAAVSI